MIIYVYCCCAPSRQKQFLFCVKTTWLILIIPTTSRLSFRTFFKIVAHYSFSCGDFPCEVYIKRWTSSSPSSWVRMLGKVFSETPPPSAVSMRPMSLVPRYVIWNSPSFRTKDVLTVWSEPTVEWRRADPSSHHWRYVKACPSFKVTAPSRFLIRVWGIKWILFFLPPTRQ